MPHCPNLVCPQVDHIVGCASRMIKQWMEKEVYPIPREILRRRLHIDLDVIECLLDAVRVDIFVKHLDFAPDRHFHKVLYHAEECLLLKRFLEDEIRPLLTN